MTIQYIENEFIKVGVNTEHGASICSLLDKASGRDVFYSTSSRPEAVQVALWGEPVGADGSWPWNPNQSGGAPAGEVGGIGGGPTVITASTVTSVSLFHRFIPALWFQLVNDTPPDPAYNTSDIVMEQTVTLDGHVVKMHYRVINSGVDRSNYASILSDASAVEFGFPDSYSNETPSIFPSDFSLSNLAVYAGDTPWSGDALTIAPPKLQFETITGGTVLAPTERWAALIDATNWGVGLMNPTAQGIIADRFFGNPGVYLNTATAINWNGNMTYEFDAYLTLGNITDIRSRFYALVPITIDAPTPVATSSITMTGTKQSGLTISGVSGATFGTVTYPTDTTWSIEVLGLVTGDNIITVRAMDTGVEVGSTSATVVYSTTVVAPITTATATVQPIPLTCSYAGAAVVAPIVTATVTAQPVLLLPSYQQIAAGQIRDGNGNIVFVGIWDGTQLVAVNLF